MPCGCEKEGVKEKPKGKLRFIGGKHKPRHERGPYRSFITGEIYEVRLELVVLPYWEPVDKPESDEAEIESEHIDKPVPPLEKSSGLTREFTGAPPSQEEVFASMDEGMLRFTIKTSGGKVDGRWGKKRLLEEALKLQ